MHTKYHIDDTSQIYSPALIVFRDLIQQNVDSMVAIAGDADRLRPHCKTHKIPQVTEIEVARGITRHKCATMAEAEMLATVGVTDVFLAYNLVGPNIARAVRFSRAFPDVRLAVTADHPLPLQQLGEAFSSAGLSIDVLLDLDTGQRRTGIEVGPAAVRLCHQIQQAEGLQFAGLHVYDGQNHQTLLADRVSAVRAFWPGIIQFRDQLVSEGLGVPRIVAGGTGTFPVFAQICEPTLELSPGTPVFYDAGYTEEFPDLPFEMAAALLTRVVSRPRANLLTCDLGTKACASDPPCGQRVVFPDLPDAQQVLHNEEHLVLQTEEADRYCPGDILWAFPRHICPTTALYSDVQVVAGGRVVDRWHVVARDRVLTV
jgi:D-serine deaminase-like pyridoxal phosphate-dependent protein